MDELLQILTGREREVELDRAALRLATVEYPELEFQPFLDILDSFARELAARVPGGAPGPDWVAAANGFLFDELGFAGNRDDYFDPRNSCLNEVLAARKGIPITLSLVYLEIARRLDRPVYGIGLPGHFVIAYDDGLYQTFIDPFHGGRLLDAEGCAAVAREAAGADISGDARILLPVSKRQILQRMIHNLRGIYLNRNQNARALQLVDLLLEADPVAAAEYRSRGAIHLRMRRFREARSDFEFYLRLEPDAPDRDLVRKQIRAIQQYAAGLN